MLFDVERGKHADHILARRHGEQPVMIAGMRDEGTTVRLQFDPEHQPHSAYAVEQVIIIGHHLFEGTAQTVTCRGHLIHETGFEDDVEHSLPRRHGERIAAISAAVRADDHALGRILRREACPHRKAAANAFCRGENVRRNAVMFIGVELARARDAALNLIEDEHQAVLIADFAQALEEFGRRRPDAAFALNRFNEKPRSMIVDERARGVEIVERRIGETGQQRFEPDAHFVLIGRANRAERAAMKCVVKGDQLLALGVTVGEMITARGLDRALDRFGTRIGEEHCVGKTVVDQPLRERFALWAAVQV